MRVDQRQEGFRAHVARPRSLAPAAVRWKPRLAHRAVVGALGAALALRCREQRQEGLLLAALAKGLDIENVEHLVIESGGSFGNQVIRRGALVEMEAVGPPLEEIDRGNAMQLEVLGLDRTLERRDVAIEEEDDLEGVAGRLRERGLEAADVDEKEALRESEILLHQPRSGEAAQGDRQHRVFIVEADSADASAI